MCAPTHLNIFGISPFLFLLQGSKDPWPLGTLHHRNCVSLPGFTFTTHMESIPTSQSLLYISTYLFWVSLHWFHAINVYWLMSYLFLFIFQLSGTGSSSQNTISKQTIRQTSPQKEEDILANCHSEEYCRIEQQNGA